MKYENVGGAMAKLIRILDHGEAELDNNLIENKIRPLALGRKNYLFAGSHAAAERIAMGLALYLKSPGIYLSKSPAMNTAKRNRRA